MKYLIGEDSFLISLSNLYFYNLSDVKDYKFHKYNSRSNQYILTKDECFELNEDLYLSEEFPFGKVDGKYRMAKVSCDPSSIDEFNKNLQLAIQRIDLLNEFKTHLLSLIRCIVPLTPLEGKSLRENGSGSSVHWFKGAIFLSPPVESPHAHLELILNIVHELGHQSLMIYQDSDEIIYNGLNVEVYSSIRKTSRPAIMSFHALVAVYYMLRLFNNKKENPFWNSLDAHDQEYLFKRESELRNAFVYGAEALKGVDWTNLGKKLYLEMIDQYLVQYGGLDAA